MSRVTTLEERIQIMEWGQAGLTDKQIAQRLARPLSTVRKWRRRAQRGGRGALAAAVGRPKQGALASFSPILRDTLRQWRQQHPGWGPQTLRAELACAGMGRLPSVASIARFLKAQGLSRAYERHQVLPQPNPQPAVAAHQTWELDARGYEPVAGVGIITLLNLNDRFSHVRLLSYPCQVGQHRWQRHPTTHDYQTALRLAFTEWGLPQRLQTDHGSVFVDNHSTSPFPTHLHLWLQALGVDLILGRPAQPRDQAMTERSHPLWERQCLQGQHYQDWLHLYHTLRQRRTFLNNHLPCRSLQGHAPLQAFPQARHSQRPYRPEWEAQLLDIQRVWRYLAQGRWFRKASKDGTFSLGGQVYYLGLPWAHQALEITFSAHDQHLNCLDNAGQLITRKPLQGITVKTLMGALYDHFHLPAFQLVLPFSGEPQSVIRLFATLVS